MRFSLKAMLLLLLSGTIPAHAAQYITSAPTPPPQAPAITPTFGVAQGFTANIKNLSATLCPSGRARVGFYWAPPKGNVLGVPDSTLGRCVFQFYYHPMIRYGYGGDHSKAMPWFLANHPEYVEWTPDLTWTGAVTGGSPTITGLSADPMTSGAIYDRRQGFGSFAHDSGFACIPHGSEIIEMTHSAITLSNKIKDNCSGTVTITISTPAYSFNKPPEADVNADYTPMSFTDTNTQNFLLSGCTITTLGDCSYTATLERGWNLSQDNVVAFNNWRYSYHYVNVGVPCAPTAQPDCRGRKHVDFSGAKFDSTFGGAMAAWGAAITNLAHRYGKLTNFNINMKIRDARQATVNVAAIPDIATTETPFLGGCRGGKTTYNNDVAETLLILKSINKPLWLNDDGICGSATQPQGAAQEYSVAGTLLVVGAKPTWHSVVSSTDLFNYINYAPNWLPDCGAPTAPAWYSNGQGADERLFPGHCLVDLNPSQSTATSYTVPTPPAGYQWKDLVTNAVVRPATYMLQAATPGAKAASVLVLTAIP